MPAATADIAAGIRAAQIETWSDPDIRTRYPRARDGKEEAAEGFFDSAADAQAALEQRAALVGVERRRFKTVIDGLAWPDLASLTVQLVDPDQSVSAPGLIGRIEVSLESESTMMEVLV